MDAYEVSQSEKSLKIVFSSNLDLVSRAVKETLAFVAANTTGVNQFSFKLGLYESLVNAVKHGCQSNPDLNVKLDVELKPSCIEITVDDGGEGFDWRSQLQREETPADIDKPSGRGLFLLKNYNCNPAFNEKGNVLSLRIDIN